jgi:hypothetical protein
MTEGSKLISPLLSVRHSLSLQVTAILQHARPTTGRSGPADLPGTWPGRATWLLACCPQIMVDVTGPQWPRSEYRAAAGRDSHGSHAQPGPAERRQAPPPQPRAACVVLCPVSCGRTAGRIVVPARQGQGQGRVSLPVLALGGQNSAAGSGGSSTNTGAAPSHRQQATAGGCRRGHGRPALLLPLLLLLPGLLFGNAAADVRLKILKDYNIGYAHGTGQEAPGAAVVNSPFMIFFGHTDTPTKCATACIHDQRCTGFVHTDAHSSNHGYDNTCYLRTDGCHDPICDKLIQKQGHHESGYLYCSDNPADASSTRVITSQELDACGHEDSELEGSAIGWFLVLIMLLVFNTYVGGGIVIGRLRGGGLRGGAQLSRWQSHPHYRQWQSFHSLVVDGIAFARAGGRRTPAHSGGDRDRGGESRGDRSSSALSIHRKHSAGSNKSGGKEKKQKQKQKQKRRKSGGKRESLLPTEAEAGSGSGRGSAGEGAAAGWSASAAALQEERDANVHSSQQKIKVVASAS